MFEDNAPPTSPKINKNIIIVGLIVLLIIAVCVIAFIGFYSIERTQTPEYSLQQAVAAVQEKDLSKFRKYVDVDTLTSRMTDDATEIAITEMDTKMKAEKNKNPFADFGQSLGKAFILLAKPSLSATIKQEIEKSVESGKIEESNNANSNTSDSNTNSPINQQSKISIKEFSEKLGNFSNVKYINYKEKLAFVGVEFENETTKKKQTIEIKMRNVDNRYWQIAEISNFKELINENKLIKETPPKK